jgi:hypothetical protein
MFLLFSKAAVLLFPMSELSTPVLIILCSQEQLNQFQRWKLPLSGKAVYSFSHHNLGNVSVRVVVLIQPWCSLLPSVKMNLCLQLPIHRGQGALLVTQVQAHLKELLQ